MIEEDLEQSVEEGYEGPSCSTSGRCIRNDMDDIWLPDYDESIFNKYTIINGQMFNGRNSKIPF